MEEVIKLNAVDQYNKMFGLETLHPLVSVVDLSEATGYPRHFTLNYGVYALFLKNTKCGDIRYGKQYYDYQDILIRVAAANAALNSFNKVLLANHIRTCVAEDIRAGKDEVIDELVTTLQKLMK